MAICPLCKNYVAGFFHFCQGVGVCLLSIRETLKIPSTKMIGWSESPQFTCLHITGKQLVIFHFHFYFSFIIICITQSIRIETIKWYIIHFIKFLLFHSNKIILTTYWEDSEHPITFTKGIMTTLSFLLRGYWSLCHFRAKGIMIEGILIYTLSIHVYIITVYYIILNLPFRAKIKTGTCHTVVKGLVLYTIKIMIYWYGTVMYILTFSKIIL